MGAPSFVAMSMPVWNSRRFPKGLLLGPNSEVTQPLTGQMEGVTAAIDRWAQRKS
jgi:hypothetical protein